MRTTQHCTRRSKHKGNEGRSGCTGAEAEKRPGCFNSDTPLDGTMCPHKMSCEVTLEPSAQSATIKVKVTLESVPLLSNRLYQAVVISVMIAKIECKLRGQTQVTTPLSVLQGTLCSRELS